MLIKCLLEACKYQEYSQEAQNAYEMSFSMKMAKKPKTLGKCLRSLQTKNTAKKPKMFRECLRSLQNRENGQEAQNVMKMAKKTKMLRIG